MSLKLPLVSWNTSYHYTIKIYCLKKPGKSSALVIENRKWIPIELLRDILFLFSYEAIVLLIPLSSLLINCWKTYCFVSQKISCTASFLSRLHNINALNINKNQKNSYSPTSEVEMEQQWNLAHLANISDQRKVFKVKGHFC